jgi:hypothetical protein
MNALKNGSRLDKKRLVIGELPKEMTSVKREARAYRRALEAEVLEAKGTISTTDCHLIDSATAATLQAGVIRWLLREKIATMTVADIRGCSNDIVRAKAARDAAVKALGLDRPAPMPWMEVELGPPALPAPEADEGCDKEEADHED